MGPKSFEEISKANTSRNGKTDANNANDSNHLGGIPAEDYATKEWVKQYHGDKETALRQFIIEQDAATLGEAKEYANSLVRNQDFSDFAKVTDVQALDKKLTDKINTDIANQKSYTDKKTQAIVDDVNSNFKDVNTAITQLNKNLNDTNSEIDDLFQSVSDGKQEIAEAITDKGVSTSATASFNTMASNIRKIPTQGGGGEGGGGGGIIVIPDGYINTNDATATADKILQGYTAYVKGNKVHGTYVPSGGGSTGGVILGENEVVAEKIFGEAGVLAGGALGTAGITLSNGTSTSTRVVYVKDHIVADRKLTENIDGIVIYNVLNGESGDTLYHASPTDKYSYTYAELGIEGDILCIAASPLSMRQNGLGDDVVQISIGTTVGIYTYCFRATGNNMNGSIGEATIYSNAQKITIDKAVTDYNAITYSNTDPNAFAYTTDGGSNYIDIHIVRTYWSTNSINDWSSLRIFTGSNNVVGLFRFSKSDRFLMFEGWGEQATSRTFIMLLDNFFNRGYTELNYQGAGTGTWCHGQLLINSQENFAIFCGKPYGLSYDLKTGTITFNKLSDTLVIPYNSQLNESNYAVFSKDDKYVYAVSFQNGAPGSMNLLGCYKVDLLNLNSQWQMVSSLLPVSPNAYIPTIDIVNNTIVCYCNNPEGIYLYEADPNVKEVIGLEWNGNKYLRSYE